MAKHPSLLFSKTRTEKKNIKQYALSQPRSSFRLLYRTLFGDLLDSENAKTKQHLDSKYNTHSLLVFC
jgi:hypothetical protein